MGRSEGGAVFRRALSPTTPSRPDKNSNTDEGTGTGEAEAPASDEPGVSRTSGPVTDNAEELDRAAGGRRLGGGLRTAPVELSSGAAAPSSR